MSLWTASFGRIFENGEFAHDGKPRIVRVGSHTGNNQLRSRIKQHFLNENKDRSIFRKNIGRAILNRDNDDYLQKWEWDLTTRENKQKYINDIDPQKQREIESEVSRILRTNFSFSVVRIDDKQLRMKMESKIISTISSCRNCSPSTLWLGQYSTKEKIRSSGLWLVNELYKSDLNSEDMCELSHLFKNNKF